MNEWFYKYGHCLVYNKGKFLLAIILFSIFSIAGIVHRVQKEIPVDFTPQAIFMDGGSEFVRLREIEETFGREDNDWIVVIEGDLKNQETRHYIQSVHTRMEELPFVTNVQSLFNLASAQKKNTDIEILSVWDAEDPITTAQQDPFLRRAFVSEDGKTTTIRIRIDSHFFYS